MINKRAQNIVEYAIILGLISTALLAMRLYFQRSIQVVIKQPVDDLGGFGTNDFSTQKIQEIGIEANLDEDFAPLIPFMSVSTVNNNNSVRTRDGGERRETINERMNVPASITEGYQRIKYDQVTQPNVPAHRY